MPAPSRWASWYSSARVLLEVNMISLPRKPHFSASISSVRLGFLQHLETEVQPMKKPFVTKQQLSAITAQYPTPFHLYDESGIRANARRWTGGGRPPG